MLHLLITDPPFSRPLNLLKVFMKKSLKLSTFAVLFAAVCSATTPVLAQVTRELRVPIDSTSLRNTAGPGMVIPVMPAPGLSAAQVADQIANTPVRQASGMLCGNATYLRTSLEIVANNPCNGQNILSSALGPIEVCVNGTGSVGGFDPDFSCTEYQTVLVPSGPPTISCPRNFSSVVTGATDYYYWISCIAS